jgi:hypothetical protein
VNGVITTLCLAIFMSLAFCPPVWADRLWSSGFELQNAAALEWEGNFVANSGALSISTTTVRSGAASLRVNDPVPNDQDTIDTTLLTAELETGRWFLRFYIRIATAPDAQTTIGGIYSDTGGVMVYFLLNANRTVECAGSSFVGTSSALNLNQWYRLEVEGDGGPATGSEIARCRLDGVEWAASTTQSLAPAWYVRLGVNIEEVGTDTGEWFIDDVAVNDVNGTAQNTYPGEGSIVHVQPDGDGDADTAVTVTGCTNAFECVDEITPDDATTFVDLTATNSVIDVAMESAASAGIGASDTVTLVQVGLRFTGVTSASTNINARVKSQSGGTVASGTVQTLTTTTWFTHQQAFPRIYTLTRYTDPQDSAAWTISDLDGMQVGAAGTDGNPDASASTLWAIVEFVPAAAAAGRPGDLLLLGVGR